MTNTKVSTNSKEFEFYQNYATFVIPKLEKLESERKKLLRTALTFTIGAIVLYILFAIVLGISPLLFMIESVLTIFIIHYAFVFNNKIKSFNDKIKTICTTELLETFGSLYWFPKAILISDEQIHKSELFGNYEGRVNDDTFSGTYKGVDFVVSETIMTNLLQGVKNAMAWPVFIGVIIMIDSNKTIKNKTIVTTKGDMNVKNSEPLLWISTIMLIICFFTLPELPIGISSFLSILALLACALGKTFFKEKKDETLNSVILEDPEFNKKYEVLSSDQIEGRYLVTTAFMERFKTLHTAFGSNKAKCAFFDDKVMFAISTNKNLFEIGDLFHPLTDMKHINNFMKEISAIYEIVDYFKLAEKTGL